jgi:hypothetical protein
MKLYVGILIVLSLLLVLTTAFALVPHRRPSLDCGNSITAIRGRDGAAMECVCIGGVLASCFEPGP